MNQITKNYETEIKERHSYIEKSNRARQTSRLYSILNKTNSAHLKEKQAIANELQKLTAMLSKLSEKEHNSPIKPVTKKQPKQSEHSKLMSRDNEITVLKAKCAKFEQQLENYRKRALLKMKWCRCHLLEEQLEAKSQEIKKQKQMSKKFQNQLKNLRKVLENKNSEIDRILNDKWKLLDQREGYINKMAHSISAIK